MKITSEVNPTTEFTRIPNSVLFDENLSAVEFRTWCQLLAMPKGRKQFSLTAAEIAEVHGTSPDVCRDRRRSLKAKGYLAGSKEELVVTMPDGDFEEKEPKSSPDQELREKLNEVWNKNKPEAFCGMRRALSVKQLITLREHASNLKQENLAAVLKGVLLGCKADPWWKEKTMKFDNVFGTGAPTEKKFSNVEKLYKLSNSGQGQAALFDSGDDQSWIDWFATKGHVMTSVKRLEMERWAGYEYEADHRGDGVIYLIMEDNCLVHWTYKESQKGVSYLPTAR